MPVPMQGDIKRLKNDIRLLQANLAHQAGDLDRLRARLEPPVVNGIEVALADPATAGEQLQASEATCQELQGDLSLKRESMERLKEQLQQSQHQLEGMKKLRRPSQQVNVKDLVLEVPWSSFTRFTRFCAASLPVGHPGLTNPFDVKGLACIGKLNRQCECLLHHLPDGLCC